LESLIDASADVEMVVIDEVQKIPLLLNEVHRLIEERGIKFLLTGSSARTLHRAHVNLLAGRAWECQLFPLTSHEIPDFNLVRYLHFGGLPAVYLSEYPTEELIAYVSTYLKEEIQAESFIRKIPAFSRFLQTAALTSGQILNFTTIASDAAVPATTVREYYHVLEDTFLGFMLPAWTKSQKRKALSSAKFYLFDLGVRNTLAGITTIDPQSERYGDAFEHFIALELRAYLSYRRLHMSLNYWRTTHGHEVDFIIGSQIAIEVKATNKIQDKHFKGLRALAEENICERYILVSHDKINRKQNEFDIIYWEDFLKMLWADQLIKKENRTI
ncbi:MAG: DUF4143 domain-containing protein, partial [Gammaproteobacteria bacterium]|nr:DUF4143 domain-containing protein [Gammaproteobacteria bacterium]